LVGRIGLSLNVKFLFMFHYSRGWQLLQKGFKKLNLGSDSKFLPYIQ
jgi:hypothetical protein